MTVFQDFEKFNSYGQYFDPYGGLGSPFGLEM